MIFILLIIYIKNRFEKKIGNGCRSDFSFFFKKKHETKAKESKCFLIVFCLFSLLMSQVFMVLQHQSNHCLVGKARCHHTGILVWSTHRRHLPARKCLHIMCLSKVKQIKQMLQLLFGWMVNLNNIYFLFFQF